MKIAREAREGAHHEVMIAGSIGPSGVSRHMNEISARRTSRRIFTNKRKRWKNAAWIYFLLETFSDIEELLAAIEAIRSFSNLPIVAQMTFSEEGTASGGTRPADAAIRLAPQMFK